MAGLVLESSFKFDFRYQIFFFGGQSVNSFVNSSTKRSKA